MILFYKVRKISCDLFGKFSEILCGLLGHGKRKITEFRDQKGRSHYILTCERCNGAKTYYIGGSHERVDPRD